MTLVKKFLTKNNKIVKKNNNFVSNEFFDNEIIINFSAPPTNLQIVKSPLKYNKDFVYSFTLDDGFSSAYNIAFLLFQGILQSGGTFSTGLTYTDGCGNNLNFRLGLSIYSLNNSGSDIHINTPNWLTWGNITELIDFDWDIYNHGYHAGITGNTYSEYYNEIKDNYDNILSKTGYRSLHFVIPNGEDGYIEPAWDYGVLSMSANKNAFIWSGVTHVISTTGVTVNNTMNFNKYCMDKFFIYTITGTSATDTTIVNNIDNIASNSTGDTKLWWYEFTHDILSVTGSSAGNLNLNTFNYLFNHIYNTYGKNGNDKIWVAPFQEVFDYLYVRDNTNITYTIDGNTARIKLNQLTSFSNLRRYQLSLNITNDSANIQSITLDGYTNYSYNGTGTTSSLINLDWSYGIITLAEKYVSAAELSKLQTDINKAQYFVNKIYITNIKNQYQNRIDAIIVPVQKTFLIDFGQEGAQITGPTGSPATTGITWNNFYTAGNITPISGLTLNLIDTTNVLSNNILLITSGFTSVANQGYANVTGATYPYTAYRDSFQILLNQVAVLTLSGLTSTSTFTIKCFGSRSSSTNLTKYTVNGVQQTLLTQNNIVNTSNFLNVVPNSNNQIIIQVEGTSGYSDTKGILSVMEIIEN